MFLTLKIFFSAILIMWLPGFSFAWGFFAHKEINKLAIFTLPPELILFYKKNLTYLSDNAINPDKRRYTVKEEACRHYIDLDRYNDSMKFNMPKYWKQAVELFSEDSLMKYGIVPWHIYLMKYKLTEAFKNRAGKDILRLSAEIGHYISDAQVPLHTTRNYNGQLTDQHGIHGFWESRLPELFSKQYNFFVGRANYLPDVQGAVWNGVYRAHAAVDSVLLFEKRLNDSFSQEKKYSIEERNGINVKVYSFDYALAYHDVLKNQVERQMTASIKLVGDIWYSCWVDAGQPDLNNLTDYPVVPEEGKIKNNAASGVTENCAH